jgi:hypothetical protein
VEPYFQRWQNKHGSLSVALVGCNKYTLLISNTSVHVSLYVIFDPFLVHFGKTIIQR